MLPSPVRIRVGRFLFFVFLYFFGLLLYSRQSLPPPRQQIAAAPSFTGDQ